MSTAPIDWTEPKTSYTSDSHDGLMDTDINTINTNVNAIENGNRTLDPSLAPSSNTGTLRQLLDRFACQIGKIMGKNWYDPVTTNFRDTFWFSPMPVPGTTLNASPADPTFISKCFCIIPPHKALKLTRVMYRAGTTLNLSGGHRYYLYGSVPGEGIVKQYIVARSEGDQVTNPYQGDLHISEHFYANSSDNDLPFVVIFAIGGGSNSWDLPALSTINDAWEGHFTAMFDFVPYP